MAHGTMVPGPSQYAATDLNTIKRRTSCAVFGSDGSNRLSPLKRAGGEFYETGKAFSRTKNKAPEFAFPKNSKKSFVQAQAEKNKVPGAGAYKIPDRTYKMISLSPLARKR